MDLIRDILLWMERGMPKDERPSRDDEPKYAYHCHLLIDAAFIEGKAYFDPIREFYHANPGLITWKGQEAMEAMRNDTVWNKTKATLADKGLPYLLDVVVSVAKGYAVQYGIPIA